MKAKIDQNFATPLYCAKLTKPSENAAIRADLERACRVIARDDRAGQAWCQQNAYKGYTSYASLDDLAWRDPAFAELAAHLDRHAAAFAKELDFDLGGRPLQLANLWINMLQPGGMHAGHIHPGSILSGTYYVVVPDGAAGLKLEDPRLALMMAAPPLKERASRANRRFIEVVPQAGTLLLWESWLRHEVPPSRAKTERISISFNYAWPAI